MSTDATTKDTQWPDFEHTKLKWVQEHIGALAERYPDKWVCIFDGDVVAAGTCAEAHDAALRRDTKQTLVMLVEGDEYFYRVG